MIRVNLASRGDPESAFAEIMRKLNVLLQQELENYAEDADVTIYIDQLRVADTPMIARLPQRVQM